MFFRLQETPKNEKECKRLVSELVCKIDAELVSSDEEKEEAEFDFDYIYNSQFMKRDEAFQSQPSGSHKPLLASKVFRQRKAGKGLTKGEKVVSLKKKGKMATSTKSSKKETRTKLLLKTWNLIEEKPKVVKDDEAIFLVQFTYRSYTVDLSSDPNCTCPRFKSINSQPCKHIVLCLLLLGVKNDEKENKILTKFKYTEEQRKIIDEKILHFPKNSDTQFQLISENFKKTLQPNKLPVEEKKRLPDLRSTINHGTFDNYNEGLRFIRDTQEEDILSKWSVVECENGKRRCPGNHKPGKL